MNGHRNLFWNLVEPEHNRARAYCRKLTGNRDDGDDLYQDSLVSALTGFEKLRRMESFRPWLYRIIINTFRNQCRISWWKRFSPLTGEVEDTIGGSDPTAVQNARRRLAIAFKAVSPFDRALVILFEMEGWSISELAGLADKTEGSIKVRLSRARNRMRLALTRHLENSALNRRRKPLYGKDKICVATKPVKD